MSNKNKNKEALGRDAERARIYRATHPRTEEQRQQQLEYARRYREENRQQLAEKGKQYYARNVERAIERTRLKRNKHRDRLIEAKLGLGGCCANPRCAITDLRVLQFDHMIPAEKLYNVSAMDGNTDVTFFEEVSKCQLLCANCHHLKTHCGEEVVTTRDNITIHLDENGRVTMVEEYATHNTTIENTQ